MADPAGTPRDEDQNKSSPRKRDRDDILKAFFISLLGSAWTSLNGSAATATLEPDIRSAANTRIATALTPGSACVKMTAST